MTDAWETQAGGETLFPAECIKACPKWSYGLTFHFPKGLLWQPGTLSPEIKSGPTLEKP